MIRHCVFLRLRADADMADLRDVMAGLAALIGGSDGCGGFAHGPNVDIEGKSLGFGYGFTFDAADRAHLAAYAAHPDHLALGARLMALSDDIVVYDLEASAGGT